MRRPLQGIPRCAQKKGLVGRMRSGELPQQKPDLATAPPEWLRVLPPACHNKSREHTRATCVDSSMEVKGTILQHQAAIIHLWPGVAKNGF